MTAKRPSGSKPKAAKRYSRGFAQAGGVLSSRIRSASEKRGFAETRLLTQWTEIVGEALAKIAKPTKISYSRDGMGATLTVLVEGANAPMVDMQRPQIVDRVNACYGYAAISRVRVTQTSPTGFGEAATTFKVDEVPKSSPSEIDKTRARDTVSGVQDAGLKQALENLGSKVLHAKGN